MTVTSSDSSLPQGKSNCDYGGVGGGCGSVYKVGKSIILLFLSLLKEARYSADNWTEDKKAALEADMPTPVMEPNASSPVLFVGTSGFIL